MKIDNVQSSQILITPYNLCCKNFFPKRKLDENENKVPSQLAFPFFCQNYVALMRAYTIMRPERAQSSFKNQILSIGLRLLELPPLSQLIQKMLTIRVITLLRDCTHLPKIYL